MFLIPCIPIEVKLEEGLNCGGAYLKLVRDQNAHTSYDSSKLDNDTPYTIMFGPDHCGIMNNKVHFIVQHHSDMKQPYVEKHFNETPSVLLDKKTHLYTLSIKNDNTVEVYIDMQKVKHGNLLTHMTPPINPPLMIDDPMDVKPADWVDEPKIPDLGAVKPADWDDDAPAKIVDTKAVKPVEWDESAPMKIPDPAAIKPVDWDDEEVMLLFLLVY